MASGDTRARVRVLLEQGKTVAEVAALLGVSRPTVCYHKRKLGYPMQDRFARRFDWAEVQAYYDAGHSVRACQRHFGFSRWAWAEAAARGAVVARPRSMPFEELLKRDQPRSRSNVKLRLIAAGIKEDRCEICGIDSWHGRPLSMALHHVNGNRHDNRLENLALLCPNCHSQTPNFGTRNRARRPGAEATGPGATAERSSRRRRAAGR